MKKQISMNEATAVWWFVTWRTALTVIVLNLLLGFAAVLVPSLAELGIVSWVSIILSIAVSVYYFKLAINRDYKTFSLVATELVSENEQVAEQV